MNKFNPLYAGCHIELPREIKMKRATINVQSLGNACFAWMMVAALHPAKKNTERESLNPHYSTVLNLTGIQFPMTLSQIKRFESLNDISINVYIIEKQKEILPLLIEYSPLAHRSKEGQTRQSLVQDPCNDNTGHG